MAKINQHSKLPGKVLPGGGQLAPEQQAAPIGINQQVRAVAEYQTAVAAHQGQLGQPQPGALQGPYPDIPGEIATLPVLPLNNPLPQGVPVIPVPQAVQQQPVQYQQPSAMAQYQPQPQQVQYQQPQQSPVQHQPQQAAQGNGYPPGYPVPSQYQNQPPQQYQEPQYPQPTPYPMPQQPMQTPAPYNGGMGSGQINPFPQQIAQPNMPTYPPPIGYQAPQAPQYGAPQNVQYPMPQRPQPQPQAQVMGTGQQAMVLQPNNPGAPPPPRSMQEYLIQNQRVPQVYPEVTDVLQGRVPGQVPLNNLPQPQRAPQVVVQPPRQLEITHRYENAPRVVRTTRWLGANVFGDFMEFQIGQKIYDPAIIEELIRGGAGDSLVEDSDDSWISCPQCGNQFPSGAGSAEYQHQLKNQNQPMNQTY